MTPDWASFTPWSSLAGGMLIGLSAAMLIMFNGRIAGISGILAGWLQQPRSGWRLAFLAGLILASLLWSWLDALPTTQAIHNPWQILLAGLLVGIGTRLAQGCTSGHGVCGLARLAPRSLLATLLFMSAGFVTVFLLRHGWA